MACAGLTGTVRELGLTGPCKELRCRVSFRNKPAQGSKGTHFVLEFWRFRGALASGRTPAVCLRQTSLRIDSHRRTQLWQQRLC